ncbi:DUF268 domain-containing protein [Patescibacteria group bacterium]|nr:DUF268 domain-containing protein [Patescibacteria group bacterium]
MKNKINLTFKQEDFIKDFNGFRDAELYIQYTNEVGGFSSYFRQNFLYDILRRLYLKYIGNPNDDEVEKIRNEVSSRWGEINHITLGKYLEKRFSNDHLRKLEYSFLADCINRIGIERKKIIDMGGGFSFSTITIMLLASAHTKVYSLDVLDFPRKSKNNVYYIVGDCMETKLADKSVDVVTLISTLEHIGLGRYGDPLDPDGDVRTMNEANRILKKGGYLILTIPYGYPTVVYNLHRVYDEKRFTRLIEGFTPVEIKYSLFGRYCSQKDIEGKKVSKEIKGYYTDVEDGKRMYNPQGGILVLLRKK